MMKLVWVGNRPTWQIAEDDEDAMMEAVRNIPESKPVVHHFGYCADERDAMPGRHAKAEFSPETGGYDYLYAELCRDRNTEKAKVRNRRHADRKYKLTPKMRKEQEYMRNWNVCMKMVNFGTWNDIPIVEGRVRSAEQIAREDYEIELRNIAEDAERDAIDAEIREWELKHAVEQANARAWMAMQNWLEWA